MRLMKRNKQPMWYSRYLGGQEIMDENGMPTGESDLVYARPVRCMVVISPVTGYTIVQEYGISQEYDVDIFTEDKNLGIDEESLIYVGDSPSFDSSQRLIPNYMIQKVSPSLNFVRYSCKKVNVSGR